MGITTLGWSAPACLPPAMRLAAAHRDGHTQRPGHPESDDMPVLPEREGRAQQHHPGSRRARPGWGFLRRAGRPWRRAAARAGSRRNHTPALRSQKHWRTSPDRLRGSQCATVPADRYRCIAADAKAPTSRKDSDCCTMLTKTMAARSIGPATREWTPPMLACFPSYRPRARSAASRPSHPLRSVYQTLLLASTVMPNGRASPRGSANSVITPSRTRPSL